MPRLLCFAALLLLLPAARAQRHPIGLDDIDRLARVSAPALSPDGSRLAYIVTTVDTKRDSNVSRLWVVNTSGGEASAVTRDDAGAAAPQWSPDGRSVGFLSSRPGKAAGTQVWATSAAGDLRQLTDVRQPILAFRWSPDGKQLLLTLRDQPPVPPQPEPIVITRYGALDDAQQYLTTQRSHLYLYDLATGKLSRLLNEPDSDEEQSAEWSPDGKSIAFFSQRGEADPDRTENTELYLAPAHAGAVARSLTRFGGVQAGPPEWSADSTRIAFKRAEAPGYSSYHQMRIAVVAAAGGPAHVLGETLDRQVGTAFFAADGRALLTTVVDDGNVYVERLPLDGGTPVRVTRGDGVAEDMTCAAGHCVVAWSTETAPPEMFALGSDGSLRALTHTNDGLLSTLSLATSQTITARSSDGTDVHSLLTLPIDYEHGERAPLLLYIHGGPDSQDARDFTLTRQLFAAHGYAVLNVNYRGSYGRGHAYSAAIQADWGDKEVDDLLASTDAAIATGTIDPDKLAVAGWSYGGILTNNILARTQRFKAASAGAGRGNLIGLYGVSEYQLQYDSELGQPWKHPDLYMKLSYPFFHADQIHTPTLYLGGDKDGNVPLAGSLQMYAALRSVGTPTELLIYPGQHHSFTRPSFVVDRYARWFAWFDGWLGLRGAPQPLPRN